MKPIKVFLRIILVVLAFFLLSCERSVAEVVERIPPGFVKLSTAGNNLYNGGLHYTIDESQISFFDADEICIYQSELTNDDFIVVYENEYYIYQGKYLELIDKSTDAKVVETIPDGFIQLNVGLRSLKNKLHYVLGETEILFLSADEICIFQTRLNNNKYIVLYENEFYFNEQKLAELINQATLIDQQREMIYSGSVNLPARGTPYTIMLFDVIESIGTEGNTLCNLEFASSVSGDCVEGYGTDIMKQIFDHVETNKGTIIDEFTIDNIRGDIQVEIPAGEELSIIAVRSPDYPGFVRKISSSSRGKSLLTWPN